MTEQTYDDEDVVEYLPTRRPEPSPLLSPTEYQQMLRETLLISEAATCYGVPATALRYHLETVTPWRTSRGRRYRIEDVERAVALLKA